MATDFYENRLTSFPNIKLHKIKFAFKNTYIPWKIQWIISLGDDQHLLSFKIEKQFLKEMLIYNF